MTKSFEELKETAASGGRVRGRNLTPEQRLERDRETSKASNWARQVLVRLHQDEYQILYQGFLAEMRGER